MLIGCSVLTDLAHWWLIEMLCAIWYHLCNLKNVKNTHRRVLSWAKLLAEVCNFTKSNTSPWVFLSLLNYYELYKQYQIVQNNWCKHIQLVVVSRTQNAGQLPKSCSEFTRKTLDQHCYNSNIIMTVLWS